VMTGKSDGSFKEPLINPSFSRTQEKI